MFEFWDVSATLARARTYTHTVGRRALFIVVGDRPVDFVAHWLRTLFATARRRARRRHALCTYATRSEHTRAVGDAWRVLHQLLGC